MLPVTLIIRSLSFLCFSGIGITAVNFLAIVFQIGYGPGTLLGIIAMKKYDLRGTLLIGSFASCAIPMTESLSS